MAAGTSAAKDVSSPVQAAPVSTHLSPDWSAFLSADVLASLPAFVRPKATVKVHPAGHVLTGEGVTLTCGIESGRGWWYQWFKDNSLGAAQMENKYTIPRVAQSDKGVYTCRGTQSTEPHYSETSEAVTLTVSDWPTVTVRVTSQSSVYTGDTVTLTCEVGQSAGWSFVWYKDSITLSQFQYTADKNPNTISVTVSGVGTAWFTCAAYRQEYFTYHSYRSSYPPYYTEESGPAVITVEVSQLFIICVCTERPKSTVKAQPADHVLNGETVTLTCDIEGGGRWQYQWSKDNKALSDAREKEYIISKADESHRGRYTCNGTQSTERCCYSQTSDAVTLTVTERPRSTVKVQPARHVFIGETVTLTCDIEGGGGWQYQWSKDNKALSDAREKEYIISKADQSHKGAYTCRGTQSTEPSYSQTSDAVTLTVSAERPKPELTSSHKGAALIGNPVVLYCKLDPSAGWKFYWSKHTQKPENEAETETPSYTISSVSVSDGGQYWCRAGRGDPVYYTHYSDALWIITKGGAVILESPVYPVPEGDPLTLRCLYRYTKPPDLTAEFYKNGLPLQTQTPGEMTIRTVSKSDEGLYHCKHPERGESPQSWISVRGASVSGSPFPVLSSLMAVSPYLLVSIILAVKYYKYYRAG
ncbi:hypothetical protein NFI96_032521, partial [Prochilodus magdalenae]